MYPIFFKKLTSPPVQTSTRAELSQHPNKYVLAVTAYSEEQLQKTEMVYQKAHHFLNMFGVKFFVFPHLKSSTTEEKKPLYELYYNEELREKYPASAVEALYNFTQENLPEHELADLIDFINIATVDDVSKLNEQNYYRVFGSQLDSQLLLIYQ